MRLDAAGRGELRVCDPGRYEVRVERGPTPGTPGPVRIAVLPPLDVPENGLAGHVLVIDAHARTELGL